MSVSSFIQQLIEDNYALGEIIAVKPIKAGDTNKSFFVITQTEEELKNHVENVHGIITCTMCRRPMKKHSVCEVCGYADPV